MKKFLNLALLLVTGLLASLATASSAVVPRAPKDQISVDFAGAVPVIDLKDLLTAYGSPAGQEKDGSRWYVISVTNGSVRPVTRVLTAGDPSNAAVHLFPRRGRPEILQVASSDAGVTVERVQSVGRHAFLVTIPPATSVSVALRAVFTDDKPSVLAWTESAIVAHSRQVAIFFAAVAGLIAAALAIMAGVAVITVHPAPGWTAVVLGFVLLARLQDAAVLDAGWMTVVGGPYGLGAMLQGLALAAALRLTDLVAPTDGILPGMRLWKRLGIFAVVAFSVGAFLGVPGAALITNALVVMGTIAITGYLVHRGFAGSKAARVIAPPAAVFAVVAAAAAVTSLSALELSPLTSGMIAGFTAAGSVLLALAIAAGEGIAILPLARHSAASAGEARGLAATQDGAAIAVRAAHQGVFDLDLATGRLTLSREGAQLIGASSARMISQDEWIARIDPDDREVYLQAIREYQANPGLSFRMEFRVRSGRQQYAWIELRATMLGDARSGSTRCLGLISDITSRKALEVQAAPSHQDALTGLGNRLALLARLEGMSDQWSGVVFAILDIDRFKAIHGSLGDQGGDRFLATVAERITEAFSPGAEVFRVGGDSFAVLAPGLADYAARVGTELIDGLAAPFAIEGRNIFASGTVGVAVGRDAEDSLELLRNAEIALQFAKRRGGGCYEVFSRRLTDTVHGDAVALEADLRRGLAENEFTVYYQPILRLGDNSIAGFEALLRWRHPERGLVSPQEFIAHSEETGLIVSLGRFALERTASDLADWQRYFPVEPPLFASVNISRRQLREESFATSLERLLSGGSFHQGTFKLEITESAIQLDPAARGVLERLHRMGAGLAIDDFGTGLSTLSELKDLPFDTVKVDRSFLARRTGHGQNSDAVTVMKSIVGLAHDLNRAVVVEGVEDERDATWLRQLGCEFAQGFYFSPPLAPEEALKFIATHFQSRQPAPPKEQDAVMSSGATGIG